MCGGAPKADCKVQALLDVDKKIAAARTATLSLDWKNAMRQLAEAGNLLAGITPPEFGDSFLGYTRDQVLDLRETKERLERALALVAGLEVKAEADRSTLVMGESFGLRADAHCRKEDGCDLGGLKLNLTDGFKET
jgi:hypothetical protein